MYIQRIIISLFCLLPFSLCASTAAEYDTIVDLSKKYEKIYQELQRSSCSSKIYIVVNTIYYHNVRSVKYNAELAMLEVTLAYQNKLQTYYFNPQEIEKLDSW